MKFLTSLFLVFSSTVGALSATETSAYPLTTCVVSGEKLGTMGKPYTLTAEGTEVQLCCQGCQAQFDKDPEKFLSKVREASAQATAR